MALAKLNGVAVAAISKINGVAKAGAAKFIGIVIDSITQYVYDTFTDTNSTALASHAPDVDVVAGGWAIDGTTNGTGVDAGNAAWDIQSNAVRQTGVAAATRQYMAHIDSGQANCLISANVTTAATARSAARVMFARSDRNNWWAAEVNSVADSFRLRTFSSATYGFTDRASAAVTINNATTYAVQITRNPAGSSTAATLDGANNISSSFSFNDSATAHGLCEYRDNTNADPNDYIYNNSYDSFLVEPL